MKYKLFILLFGFFLFTASTCEKPFNIDSLDEPKLVLNCLFSPNKPMAVSLGSSRPILDGEPRVLSGETVEIVKPDGDIITLNLETANFKTWFIDSTFYPEAGVNYIVNASAPNFEPIKSNNIIPEKVEVLTAIIDSVKVEKSQSFGKVDHYFDFKFQLEDKPGDHYYHLYAFRQKVFFSSETGIDIFEEFDEYLINDKMSFNNTNGLVYTDNSILFKDEGGQSPDINFEIGFTYFQSNVAIKKLRFELRTVSKEYYQFHVSKRKQELIAIDQFAEPIILSNNIEGGLGLFGGYNTFQIEIDTLN